MKNCYIELGSNTKTDEYLLEARRYLERSFTSIRFATIYKTEAIDFLFPCTFYNQTVKLQTNLSKDAVQQVLKEIENVIGRNPDDKEKGIVKIDIDLLSYDEEILRPADWKREYVRRGVAELP